MQAINVSREGRLRPERSAVLDEQFKILRQG
jgi:hypothetical protein